MPSSATTYLSSSSFLNPSATLFPYRSTPSSTRTVIPRERGQPFPNNIRSSYPAFVEVCAKETNPYLSGNDFGFR